MYKFSAKEPLVTSLVLRLVPAGCALARVVAGRMMDVKEKKMYIREHQGMVFPDCVYH